MATRPPSPATRPEWDEPLVVATSESDDTGWLVTFSDLVLQLFAFVIVVAVCGGAAQRAAARAQPPPPAAAADAVRSAYAAATPPADASANLDERPERVATDALAAFEPATVWAGDRAPLPDVAVREQDRQLARTGEELDRDGERPDGSTRGDDGDGAVAASVRAHRDDPRLRALASYLAAYVAASGQADQATVTPGDGDVHLAFGGRLGFHPGSAELLPEGRGLLREVRRLARAVPDLAIEVAGYTDDVPIHSREFPSNLELSLARAARVAREIERDDPALAVRTVALGFGQHRALAPNDGPVNRARNRRVEVRLVARDQSMP